MNGVFTSSAFREEEDELWAEELQEIEKLLGQIEKEQEQIHVLEGEIKYYKDSYMRFRKELVQVIQREE